MTDITIPPEALEAAAKEFYEQERALGGRSLPSWEDAGPFTKRRFYTASRAACLAMLNAWPGMIWHPQGQYRRRFGVTHLILPLTESKNAEG